MTKTSRQPPPPAAASGDREQAPAREQAPWRHASAQTSRDIDMRIARDGTWYYHGSPIGRKPLVRLFSRVLRREGDGQYYLVTPVEKCRVEVDDAPFVAVEVTVTGEAQDRSLTFRTNVDDQVTADAEHPIRLCHDPVTGEIRPYVMVRGGLEALVARSVYYELVDIGVEERVGADYLFGVWSQGTFFPLGKLDE